MRCFSFQASAASFLVSLLLSSQTALAAQGPTVTIDAGVVIGTTTSLPVAMATVNKFLGIPFAKSPPARFRPPEKPDKFEGAIDATKWSPACIQQFVYPEIVQNFAKYIFDNPSSEESEDCLYLNVYAPSTPPPPGGRPVMFWIYGGALHFGNAGMHFYDGSWYASYEDVIVVSANYRTNVFGFPPSPEIPLKERNLGFLDQRLALDWVQRNIAAFGGSPKKVTIFGESAGAWSIDALLTSYPADSKPPFRAAILQSGQISYRYLPQISAVPAWDKLTAHMGCPGSHKSILECMTVANSTEITKFISEEIMDFTPVADNVTLMAYPADQRLKGDIAYVPVLAGTNSQEGRVFALSTTNATQFLSQQGTVSADFIKHLIENVYPLNSPLVGSTDWDQAGQILTELVFQCSQARWVRDTAGIGIPTWRYYYNASFPNTQAWANLGVFHSSEIPLVFGTYSAVNATVQQYALSQTIMSAWARFARNPLAGPGWNPVGSGAVGNVVVGDYGNATAGYVTTETGVVSQGDWSLAVLGNRGDSLSSGVTVIDAHEVDFRCAVFDEVYDGYNRDVPPTV